MVCNIKRVAIILVFCLSCFNLYACSDSKQTIGYIEVVKDETHINGLVIKKHIITAEYQKDDGVLAGPYLNASIKFPQISGIKNKSVQGNINKLLREIAMETLSSRKFSETLNLFTDIANGRSNEFWSGENKYKILYVGENSISLNYEGESFFGGANPSHISNYVTISLNNGVLIPFTDYFSKNRVIEAIKLEKFEWIEGQYTGGYKGSEPEIIRGFVEALKQLADANTVSNIYNSASTYNFAIDEQFVYISFPFDDSLDGYITLKFNLSDLYMA